MIAQYGHERMKGAGQSTRCVTFPEARSFREGLHSFREGLHSQVRKSHPS